MSRLYFKYLGLTDADVTELQALFRAHHPRGGMQTASYCVCGSSSGGGQGFCTILEKLSDAGRHAGYGRPPRRDPSVCNHEYNGALMIYEYEARMYCELCGSCLESTS